MSDYALRCRDPVSGAVTFDSRDAEGGTTIDFVTSIYGGTTVRSYSQYAGREIEVMFMFGFSLVSEVSISYASGYPVFTVPASMTSGYDATYLVFVL